VANDMVGYIDMALMLTSDAHMLKVDVALAGRDML
jgi:hypothetical protein